MAAVAPSAVNSFIPDHAATDRMVIDFARNPKDFEINRYVQIIPVKKMAGYYLRMTVEEAGRIGADVDGKQFAWPDGQAAREGVGELETFDFAPYRCFRRQYPFLLGDLTIEQASWDVLAQHASIKSRLAMTMRTQLVATVAQTEGNYDASHVLDVDIGGDVSGNSGKWSESTTARQDIKRSLTTAAELILDDTLGAVSPDDLQLVMSSGMAAELAQTQELVDYIKGSPDALAQVRGELKGGNTMYGLPDKLYGIPIVVDKTRKTTSKKGATTTKASVVAKATPFLTSRVGGLTGIADAPNFSTIVIFSLEEMTVEQFGDRKNRRTLGRVVDNYVVAMVAPASGVLFKNAA